jgi:hypothetical protein
MKIRHNIITACLSILLVMNCMGNELPPEAKRLEQQRNEAVLRIDSTYSKELEKIKVMYTKRGDLEAANAINELISKIDLKEANQEIPSLNQSDPISITVKASDSGKEPKATKVFLKKGQKFSIEPNKKDEWSASGGTKLGKFCNFMGYPPGYGWMRMMFRVGDGNGVRVEDNQIITANEDGELFLYANDDYSKGNEGEIRVKINLNPK